MSTREFDLKQYSNAERQVIALYESLAPFNESFRLPSLIFVHGGAWKDPNNSYKDATFFSQNLNLSIPFASVDYRLSSEVKYPGYLEDLGAAIKSLQLRPDDKISLVGHSVGALMSLQFITENRVVPIDSVYLLDGIYDMDELIKEYPEYKSFVDEAHDDYKTAVRLDVDKLRGVKVHIIHSYEDELLSLGQSKWLIEQLEDAKVDYTLKIGNFGKHDDVYNNQKVVQYVNESFY